MRNAPMLLSACLGVLLFSAPAAAQPVEILPLWQSGEQSRPAAPIRRITLPVPAPMPPARPSPETPEPPDAPDAEPDTADSAPDEPAPTAVAPVPPARPDREDDEGDEPDIAEKGEIDPGFPDVSQEETCRLRLEARGVRFEKIDSVGSGKACGIPSAIRLTALSPSDTLSQPARLNCRTAEALADWYFEVVAPAARRHFDAVPTGLRVAASYVCRNRNSNPDGPISEHAFGNAIDISAILFREREAIAVSRPRRGWQDGFFLREINAGACAIFTTVIGPEGDAAHRDHFHFDMKERDGGYRLCQ